MRTISGALWLVLGCAHTPEVATPPPPPPLAVAAPASSPESTPEPTPEPTSLPAMGGLVFVQAHRRDVSDLAFDPSGRVLVTASADGSVALVDVATGALRASRRAFVRTGRRRVLFGASAHEPTLVSSGGYFDGTGGAWTWDLHGDLWTPLFEASGPYFDFIRFGIARDGSRFVLAEPDAGGLTLRLRDLDGEEQVLDVAAERAVRTSFSPDGSRLLVGLNDPEEQVLVDTTTGAVRATIEGQLGEFVGDELVTVQGTEVTFRDRDGAVLRRVAVPAPAHDLLVAAQTLLVLGSGDAGLSAWSIDTRTGELGARVAIGDDASIVLAPDGSAAFALEDGHLHRYALPSGQLVSETPTGPWTTLTISPDGRTLAAVDGHDVVLWDVAQGALRARVPGGSGEHSVWGMVWSPDGRELVTYGRGGIERWGTRGARTTPCQSATPPVVHADGGVVAYGVPCDLERGPLGERTGFAHAQSADGARVLLQIGDALHVLADGRTTRLAPLGGCRGGACIGLVAADATVAHVAYRDGSQVRVLDVERGRTTALRAPPRSSAPTRVVLAPDASFVLELRPSATGQTVRVVDVGTRRTRFSEERASGDLQIAIASDASRIALGTATETRVLDARDGSVVTSAPGIASFRDLRFAPDGRSLVLRGTSELVIVDVASGDVRHRIGPFAPSAAVSESAERIARCEGGRLVVQDLVVPRRDDRGSCRMTDELVLSPNGARLAQREDAVVHVHRLDGGTSEVAERITLRTYRLEGADGTSSFWVAEDSRGRVELADEALVHFRYRAPGPLVTAPLRSASEAPRRVGLVAGFFAE